MRRGKYIAIEGIDGVGKTTILELLANRLRSERVPVKILAPSHNSAKDIRQLLEEGVFCLADYSQLKEMVTGYYGTGTVNDRHKIGEHTGVNPDITLLLDVPVPIIRERYKLRFGDERMDDLDDALQERIRAGYLWEAHQRNIPVVYAIGDPERVFASVWQQLADVLDLPAPGDNAVQPLSELISARRESLATGSDVKAPVRTNYGLTSLTSRFSQLKTTAKPDFLVPTDLPKPLLEPYTRFFEDILKNRTTIMKTLPKGELAAPQLVLPLACVFNDLGDLQPSNKRLAAIARNHLTETYGLNEPVILTKFWPRTELSLAADLLYPHSSLSFTDLCRQADDLPYEQKASIIIEAVRSGITLNCTYSWDIICSYAEILELANCGIPLEHQVLSPRFGYEVPDVIEDSGLTDIFETCFDRSLEFFSKLQASGLAGAAQNVVLAGHKQRVRLTLNMTGLRELQRTALQGTKLNTLVNMLVKTVLDVHPLLSEVYNVSSTPARKAKI